MDILTLLVHQLEGVEPITNHFVHMVVRRNDKMLTSSQVKKKILAPHQRPEKNYSAMGNERR